MSQTVFICCSCDSYYGGDALQCGRERGVYEPCGCDCHKIKISAASGNAPLGDEKDILAEQFKVASARSEAWKQLALAVRDEYGKATSLLGDAAGRLYTFSVYHDAGKSLPDRAYDEARELDEKIQATMKAANIPIPEILREELR